VVRGTEVGVKRISPFWVVSLRFVAIVAISCSNVRSTNGLADGPCEHRFLNGCRRNLPGDRPAAKPLLSPFGSQRRSWPVRVHRSSS